MQLPDIAPHPSTRLSGMQQTILRSPLCIGWVHVSPSTHDLIARVDSCAYISERTLTWPTPGSHTLNDLGGHILKLSTFGLYFRGTGDHSPPTRHKLIR